jgi:hypothetical protein
MQNASMAEVNHTIDDEWITPPSEAEMRGANINPKTGLATDFLNPFNEYIMLAELVADGSMEPEVLSDWIPVDYETHFSFSGFRGAEVVLAAFRSLSKTARAEFDNAVNTLVELILDHQMLERAEVNLIDPIKLQRDHLSSLISDPEHVEDINTEETQAAIDALFD